MDLDQLQSVRDRERQTDRLQQLRESFYEEAADFVADLRAQREEAAAAADDPFDSPQVNRLTDRIRTAEQTLEAIYEKRVGKVVKAATFAAADLPAEAEGMTKEEADLFDTLVDEIEENRARVLDRLAGEGTPAHAEGESASAEARPPGADRPTGETDAATDDGDGVSAADVMGGGSPADPDEGTDGDSGTEGPPSGDDSGEAGADSARTGGPGAGEERDSADGTESTDTGDSSDAAGGPDGRDAADGGETDVERALVRITDDVGPILGVDEREYDLAADDVVTLPAENARPLVERGAAERLE